MKNHLYSQQEYEHFLYTITDNFPSVHYSTIISHKKGSTLGVIKGDLYFEHGFKISAREVILYNPRPATIQRYGYEIWHSENKICWYDSQPHPDNQSLSSSFPHHKHVSPNIKHNRIPAPQISFVKPNLPVLIREVEELISTCK